MKRIIITSVCTLALSLFGTLGANQVINSYDNESKNVSKIEDVEETTDIAVVQEEVGIQEIVKEKTNTNLQEDSIFSEKEQKTTKSTITEEVPQIITQEAVNRDEVKTTLDNKVVSPKKEIATNSYNKEVAQVDTVTQANTVAEANTVAKVNTLAQANTVAQTKSSPVAQVKSNEVAQTNNNATQQLGNKTVNNNVNYGKAPVLVYKNVDLSQCDTTSEVIQELQKNGYNVNGNNIYNNEALKEILSYIQKRNNTGSTNPVQQPTTKPSAPTSVPTSTPSIPNKPSVPTSTPSKPSAPTSAPSVPTNTPSNSTGISNYANQVLQLVNQERAKAGLSAFTTAPALTAAANKRAEETKVSFSHTRPNGTSFTTALQEFNVVYRTAGENIAYGQRTPQEVVTGWMNSPGHRANILNGNFNKIGIGVYSSNGVIYWSQLFTN